VASKCQQIILGHQVACNPTWRNARAWVPCESERRCCCPGSPLTETAPQYVVDVSCNHILLASHRHTARLQTSQAYASSLQDVQQFFFWKAFKQRLSGMAGGTRHDLYEPYRPDRIAHRSSPHHSMTEASLPTDSQNSLRTESIYSQLAARCAFHYIEPSFISLSACPCLLTLLPSVM
jgi:hypothetical protein